MSMVSPKLSLFEGAEILEKVLAPKDFRFQFHGEGKSSGGDSVWVSSFEATGDLSYT
jgi:hypothetical protein